MLGRSTVLVVLLLVLGGASTAHADDSTRLLRQPSVSGDLMAFTYGADVWIVDRDGGQARRITSTPAVESRPTLSPDGRWIAFTSDRAGTVAVYVVSVDGGTPRRLTWHPASSWARGWTPDGERVLYVSTRDTSPEGYGRMWTVDAAGGPSTLLPAPWAYDGSFDPSGRRVAIDRVTRWDGEWQDYRGGQNTPLLIMDLQSLDETFLPYPERTTDRQPVWIGDTVYFRSDRDGSMDVWAYDVDSAALRQVTQLRGSDVKWIAGDDRGLVVERDGFLHRLDPDSGELDRIDVIVRGDFPWAETRWEDVGDDVDWARLSPCSAGTVKISPRACITAR